MKVSNPRHYRYKCGSKQPSNKCNWNLEPVSRKISADWLLVYQVKIDHLNVNSLKNKYTTPEELIKAKIEVRLISETKIGELFPNQQFKINSYKMIQRDRDQFAVSLTFYFYVNEQVHSKVLTLESVHSNGELVLVHFKSVSDSALDYINRRLKMRSIFLIIY